MTHLNKEVGNPINIDALPHNRNTVLRTPIRILTPAMESAHARRLLWRVLYVQYVTLFSTLFVFGAVADTTQILWLCGVAVVVAWTMRPAGSSVIYLVLLVAALFYGFILQWIRFLPSDVLAYLCVVGVIVQGVVFRNNYRALALAQFHPSAIPNDLQLPWSRIVPFFDACRDWLVYGVVRMSLPGQFRSPAGSYTTRLTLSLVVLILVALTCHTYALDLWQLAHDEQGIGTGAMFLPFGLFLLSFFLPLPIVALTCFIAAYGILPRSYALKRAAERPDALAKSFYPMLDSVRNSPNEHERESIPIGQVLFDKSIVFAPYEPGQHWWISGSTGAGKTAMLLRLMESFFNRGNVSLVVIDMKSDTPELYYTGEVAADRLEARRRAAGDETPVPRWIYNNQPGQASHLFSPFHQSYWQNSTPEQKSALMLDVMAISLGSEYGESYYKDIDDHLLSTVFRKYPDIKSYRQLHQRIEYEVNQPKSTIPKSILHDANHAAIIIHRLGKPEQRNDCGQHSKAVRENSWDLDRFYREECVGYCRLPIQLDPVGSAEDARIILSNLLKTGLYLSPAERKMHVVVICDEWQCFFADGADRAIAQARSTNTSLILANQNVADLVRKSIDLTSAVESNCAVNLWFKSVDQKGLKQIENLGGTTIEHAESVSIGQGPNGSTRTVTRSEQTVPRMPTNRVAAAAARDDQFICRFTANHGFVCYNSLPFICSTGGFHITKEEYEERKNAPWPVELANTIVVGREPVQPSNGNGRSGKSPKPPVVGTIGESSLRRRTRS